MNWTVAISKRRFLCLRWPAVSCFSKPKRSSTRNSPMSLPSDASSAPLAGIRVLDFTHVLAGPFCTRFLADLGADVVRVESSKHPDHPWPSAFVSDDGRHASYLNTNRSKRAIAIDLKQAAGKKLASELAGVADVLVENFSAGVMERLALGY